MGELEDRALKLELQGDIGSQTLCLLLAYFSRSILHFQKLNSTVPSMLICVKRKRYLVSLNYDMLKVGVEYLV